MKYSCKLILCFFIVSFTLFSCVNNKSKEISVSAHDAFVSNLTSADTANVKQLCEDFFSLIKVNDKDAAFALLKSFDGNKIQSLSREQMAKLSTQFTIFPVLDYSLKDFKIGDATDNICSYSVVFNRTEEGKDDTINFGFCPIKIDGVWYLTIRNASAEVSE